MSIYENWQSQKNELTASLISSSEPTDVLYQIRHAIQQTEQLSLAECENDTLRQQAGILFAVVKNSLSLLESVEVDRLWQELSPAITEKKPFSRLLGWISVTLCYALSACLWFCKQNLFAGFSALIAVLFTFSIILSHKKQQPSIENVKASLRVSQHSLFASLDQQFHSFDRYLADFQYLNDSDSTDTNEQPDERTVYRAVSLLQSLFSLDTKEDDVLTAIESSKGLLSGLGIQWMDYSLENQRFFSVLPSRNYTRVLCPALFSAKDGSLLAKGKVVLPMNGIPEGKT